MHKKRKNKLISELKHNANKLKEQTKRSFTATGMEVDQLINTI